MTILVTGATSTVGRHVVKQLVQKGVRVRAVSRNPAIANLPEDVEVVQGDLNEPESLQPLSTIFAQGSRPDNRRRNRQGHYFR
ncbi:SDR family oxidoreductase [Paenibacillus thailandensis]|uniref:SDR family oxidoreductase n=1 Tax=Paenibacillus thailandensis TaxID=393250 RepID=A0ABW5R2N7_9BACL